MIDMQRFYLLSALITRLESYRERADTPEKLRKLNDRIAVLQAEYNQLAEED